MLLVLPSFSLNYGTKPQDHLFSHFTWYKGAEKFDTIVSIGDKGIALALKYAIWSRGR